jgi:hypothetical protein
MKIILKIILKNKNYYNIKQVFERESIAKRYCEKIVDSTKLNY